MSNIKPENLSRTDQSIDTEKQTSSTLINSNKQQTLNYQRSNSFQDENIILNNTITQEFNNFNATRKSESNNDLNKALNYFFRSPNSIESVNAPSPAGSIEQFDVVSTPLSVDDTSDLYLAENTKYIFLICYYFSENNCNIYFKGIQILFAMKQVRLQLTLQMFLPLTNKLI
jgi:hypothetical protein